MNKDFIKDYFGFILLRAFGPLIRILPIGLALFFGRLFGRLIYWLDRKHRAIAYANIKTAFKDKTSNEISRIVKDFYLSFGQSIIEVFWLPKVDEKYVNKYIKVETKDNVAQAFSKGKGVILLSMHSGSWELSNIIAAYTGYPFNLFVREQKFPRLDKLLNQYRQQKGCKLIQRENQLRRLIEVLRANEAVGMTIDQGGSDGVLVNFFGKSASMSTGAIRLALKYDCAIAPVYYLRIRGAYSKVIVGPPIELKKSGNLEKDIAGNLDILMNCFEKNIALYPKDYLWTYKIWKYSDQRNILILSDGKTGHLRQSEGACKILEGCLKNRGLKAHVQVVEVKFKSEFARRFLMMGSCFSGKYSCQGCLWCFKKFLDSQAYNKITALKADFVISCGSSLAAVNFIIARENLAKSIVIMRPSFLSMKRFDLVIMNKHDRPPKRKNLVEVEGALNLIDEEYLNEQAQRLIASGAMRQAPCALRIGLLIGGDTKDFYLKAETVSEVIKQVKSVAQKLNAGVLITTSRRTSKEVEDTVKNEFKDYPRLELLVIANEKNIPDAIGGILGLSQIIITSPESISMISESVNSRKYVLVFTASEISRKHKRFLDLFAKNEYIYKVAPQGLSDKIEDIWRDKPEIKMLKDNLLVSEKVKLLI